MTFCWHLLSGPVFEVLALLPPVTMSTCSVVNIFLLHADLAIFCCHDNDLLYTKLVTKHLLRIFIPQPIAYAIATETAHHVLREDVLP